MPDNKSRNYSLITLIFLVGIFSMSILKTSDPDAWIHLTFGRLIWENQGFPATEPFIPSMAGQPFSYSSWLFGLIYYLAYRLMDVYGIVLLKAFTITTMFCILLKDALIPYRKREIATMVLIVIAFLIRPRFVERPDTFLMLFLSFSIFSINAFIHDNKKYLYVLPFIHLLWANSHSSIIIMFIPFLAVFIGGGIGNVLSRRGINTGTYINSSQVRLLCLIFIASILLSVVSPYGINQFTFAFQFLNVDVFKQEIAELKPTEWVAGCRWFYVLVGLCLVSFVAAGRRLLLTDLARIIPFIYLGIMSFRFTYVFVVVAAPILIRNIAVFEERLRKYNFFAQQRYRLVGSIIAFCWIAGWSVIGFGQIGSISDSSLSSGVGFDLTSQPEFALQYMDQRNITGKIYNDFSWGQYIEWRDAPKLIPFIDGRGYLAPDLIENVVSLRHLDEIAKNYGIEASLYRYPALAVDNITNYDVGLPLSQSEWALVYWDDISLVYLKRDGKYDSIIHQDEYHFVKPANGTKAIELLAKEIKQREPLIDELQRNIKLTGSSRAYLLLSYVYLSIGNYQQAIEILQRVKDKRFIGIATTGLGRCYEQLGDTLQAIKWFEVSLKHTESFNRRGNSNSHYHIGFLLLKIGDASTAVGHLKKAIELDKYNYEAYSRLAEAYRKLGKDNDATKILRNTMESKKAMEFFDLGVKVYMEGHLADASEAFGEAIKLDPSFALSYANLGFVQWDMVQKEKAFVSFQKALELEPRCAVAHYGLAMVYKFRGDLSDAHIHCRNYLDIEPTGFFARIVKKELEK